MKTRRDMRHGMITLATVVLVLCACRTGQGGTVPAGVGGTVTNPVSPMSGLSLPLPAGSLVLADFNGDGRMDAALPGLYVAGVNVFVSGQSPTPWYDAGRMPVALAAGDFDGDGHVDLAVALRGEGGVAILTNDGSGQFTRTAFYPTGLGPVAVAVIDVNHDGKPDLVVANRGDSTVSVLLNTGSGFTLSQTETLPALLGYGAPEVSSQPVALTVVDVNGDGAPDVVVACAGDDSVKILYNINHTLMLGATYPAGPSPVAVAAGDVNGDGLPDLVVADSEGLQVTVLTQDFTGQFSAQDVFLTSPPLTGAGVHDVALVDLDGDGSLDIRCPGYVLYNDGHGQFGTPQTGSVGISAVARLAGYPGTFIGRYDNSTMSATVSVDFVRDAKALAGDVNGDGFVNILDLQLLVGMWGQARNGSSGLWDFRADLNGDGYVNVGDLQILIANWGRNS